MTKASSFKS